MQEMSEALLAEVQRGILLFPAHHIVEEPVDGVVRIGFPGDPLTNMLKPAFPVTTADEAVRVIRHFPPFGDAFWPGSDGLIPIASDGPARNATPLTPTARPVP